MASSTLPRTPRSLADDLRSRTPGQIRRLLALRPDLVHPWPADVSQLARRAADDASVLEAMQSLTTTQLRVLEAFACLHETTSDDVVRGLPDDPDAVTGAVAQLWSMALLWGGPHSHRIVRAAQQAFGPHPCGLAAAGHSAIVDPPSVRATAAGVDAGELERLVWHDPVLGSPHPLAVPRGEQFTVPRETALVLRDGKLLAPVAGPPAHPAAPAAPGHSLWTPVAGVRYVLTHLSRDPLPWNPARGVSRRTLTDRANTMAVPVDDLLVWLELAAAAGLVGGAADSVRLTAAADPWLRSEPAQMWTVLIGAWLDSDRPLASCQPEALGCLTTTGVPRTAHHRHHVLTVWPGGVTLDAEGLARTVAWERPRMQEAAEQAGQFFGEALHLGLVEAGVATAALELLPGDVAQAAGYLAAAQTTGLIVQPDHTVIAPVAIDTATWELLQELAHLESWGPVTMHRIEPARLRAAVSGHSPDEIIARLSAASRTPLPQAVEYLVRDAARGSAARVYQATMVEAMPEDAVALRELGLAEVAPQVFTSDLPVDVVNRRLAAAGIVTTGLAEHVVAQPLDYPRAAPAPDEQAVSRLVGHLLGDEAEVDEQAPQLQDADPDTMADVCRRAISTDQRLWLRYSEGDQTRTDLIEPIDLRSGLLTGWSLSAGRTVSVPLSRIAAHGGLR